MWHLLAALWLYLLHCVDDERTFGEGQSNLLQQDEPKNKMHPLFYIVLFSITRLSGNVAGDRQRDVSSFCLLPGVAAGPVPMPIRIRPLSGSVRGIEMTFNMFHVGITGTAAERDYIQRWNRFNTSTGIVSLLGNHYVAYFNLTFCSLESCVLKSL